MYVTTQQAADLITRLFRRLFDLHGLDADLIGDTIVVAGPSADAA
ncbi:hypothetical protein ACFV9E_03595 [Streptomyces sp. NPDC059835]